MIKPLGDRVILQATDEEEKTVGGIVLASNAKGKPVQGKVVAVSTTAVGELEAPVAVKEGDQVMFDKYAGQEITIDDVDYLVIHEKDILGIL